VEQEVALLVIHGVLHLLGYEDEVPEREMEMKALEGEILGKIKFG
jgi:rRNA maturation RNase YbeY